MHNGKRLGMILAAILLLLVGCNNSNSTPGPNGTQEDSVQSQPSDNESAGVETADQEPDTRPAGSGYFDWPEDDWRTMAVYVDGVKYQMPMNYIEFIDAIGYTQTNLSMGTAYVSNGTSTMYLDLKDLVSHIGDVETMDIKGLQTMEGSSRYAPPTVDPEDTKIGFAGGIEIGSSTYSDVVALWGEPDLTSNPNTLENGQDSYYCSWYYGETGNGSDSGGATMKLLFLADTDVICGVDLSFGGLML